MNTHVDPSQENKSQAVSAVDSLMKNGSESTFQFVDNRPEAAIQLKLQAMANNSPQAKQAQFQTMVNNHSLQQKQQQPIQKKENNTGLPDNLKTGIEDLSGMSLDDVKVHRNSDKPAQLQAHAYAQGSDIHLGPSQEKHMPHEAWHVVQQKQGRVKPTTQLKGQIDVNDDVGLEKEADKMGAIANSTSSFANNSKKGSADQTTSDNNFYTDVGLILQAKWVLGVAQLVKFDGTDIPVNPHNQQILKDALDAILEVQDGSNGFLDWAEELIDKTEADGVPTHEDEIEAFYTETKETWFSVNPILREAWNRCIASTRKIADKSKYHKVGGKFKRKLEQLLTEIEEDFASLATEIGNVESSYINKEHIENKGLGGPQVQHDNLMDAGVGPMGLGSGSATLSDFHIALHRLKAQGQNLFNSLDSDIQSIIQAVKASSTGAEMGSFT